MLRNATAGGLRRNETAVHLAIAGEMRESVDMRADMAAQRQGFRRGTRTVVENEFAMEFIEAEKIRRMCGMMRHADEEGLPKIVDFGRADGGNEISHIADVTAARSC